jgi:hypothetical protein
MREAAFERPPTRRDRGGDDGDLALPPDDRHYERVRKGYPNLWKFLPQLLEAIPFDGTAAGSRVLGGLGELKKLEHRRRVTRLEADDPTFMVPTAWRPHVFPGPGVVDRHALSCALVDELHEALHRRDLFVNENARWGDPRRLVIDGKAWQAERPRLCRALEREAAPQAAIAALGRAGPGVSTNGRQNDYQPDRPGGAGRGRDTLVLTPLDALPEPSSLGGAPRRRSGVAPGSIFPDGHGRVQRPS